MKFFIAIATILIGIIVISKRQKGDLSDITSDNIEVYLQMKVSTIIPNRRQ